MDFTAAVLLNLRIFFFLGKRQLTTEAAKFTQEDDEVGTSRRQILCVPACPLCL